MFLTFYIISQSRKNLEGSKIRQVDDYSGDGVMSVRLVKYNMPSLQPRIASCTKMFTPPC